MASYAALQPAGLIQASTVFFRSSLMRSDWNKAGYHLRPAPGTPTTFTLEGGLATRSKGHQMPACAQRAGGHFSVSFALLQLGASAVRQLWIERRWRLADANGITHALAMNRRPSPPAGARAPQLVWVRRRALLTILFLPAAVCREGVASVLIAWGAVPTRLSISGQRAGRRHLSSCVDQVPSGGATCWSNVITRDDRLHRARKLTHMRMGFGVGVGDVESVLRSLPQHGAATSA
jgi:cystathionine beta-lyase